MGVFLFSNKKINTSKVEDVIKTRGHKGIVKHDVANSTLISSNKIIIENDNYLTQGEISALGGVTSDFAIGIGTYFYKGTYGKEALKKVYEDLDKVLKDNPVYGHWAFCIHKDGATYVFNDMSGFMRLYYYENEDQIVVSSSHLGVISTVKKPKFDKARLTGFVAGTYGREEGFVNGVALVDPHKYLKVNDGQTPLWIERVIPETKRIETLDEAVLYVTSLFKQQMDEIVPAIGDKKIYVDATGGLDSRLITCNVKTSGLNFDYINYPIFGPDAEIANVLSKSLKKKLHVQTHKPCGEDYSNHYGEYDFGNNFFRQYPNPRWTLENDFEFSGARGECIDLPDIYSDEDLAYMKDPRSKALLPHLTTHPIMREKAKQDYLLYMENYVLERCGISADALMTECEQVEFTQFLAGQNGDANYNSGAQAHCYFYSMYNEWHFNHFIKDIAFNAKSCRKLTIALIKQIDQELASLPFVSRRRTKRNSVNEVSELPMKYWGYGGIKKLMPKSLLSFLYGKLGRKFNEQQFNSIDIELYADLFDVKELSSHKNLYSDILNRLYSVDKIRKIFNIEF